MLLLTVRAGHVDDNNARYTSDGMEWHNTASARKEKCQY